MFYKPEGLLLLWALFHQAKAICSLICFRERAEKNNQKKKV